MIYFWSKGKVIHKNNTRRERKGKKGLVLLLHIINMKIPQIRNHFSNKMTATQLLQDWIVFKNVSIFHAA